MVGAVSEGVGAHALTHGAAYRHVVRENKVNSQTGMTRVTTRTLVLLFIAFLALAAGAFNLRDRLTQKPIYSDGVVWRDVEGLDVVFNGAESEPAARKSGGLG